MHAIAPEAYNSYPFFGERGMLHRQLATASVRTAGACKLLYIYRHNFGRFLHLVPDFASRVKFVAETRVKLQTKKNMTVRSTVIWTQTSGEVCLLHPEAMSPLLLEEGLSHS